MLNNCFDNLIPTLVYFVSRKCSSTWSIEKKNISFHDLTYVYSGQATYIVNDAEYHLKQGDFIYIPSGNVREAYTYPENPMHCYAVNFELRNLDAEHALLPFPRVFNVGRFGELISLYEELNHIWVEKNPGYHMQSRAVFMLILHRLISHVNYNKPLNSEDSRIAMIKEYILANYHMKIEIEHLADIAGLHPVYLGALFKKVNHCTIKEYINRIRINNAENLLSTGGYTVSEAAGKCGFEDIFYFSKVFKNQKGFSPSYAMLKSKNKSLSMEGSK